MNNHIFKKESVTPVMAEHIKRVNFCPPNIDIETASDEGINQAIGVLREHIYAKVVDMQDKLIVDAVIDFARSEGFTDVYLIDKTYIMAALESKQLQDELERDLEEGQKLLEDRKATIEQLVHERDRLLRDLKDAEERNNVKDALIDEQRKKIDEMRDELLALRNKNKCLVDGIHTRDVIIARGKSENIRLEGELNGARAKLTKVCEENKELIAANENLNDRIKKMDKKLRDHEGNNSDNNIVIEYQNKKIHELECQLRKYKVAGMFIKASLEAAEDPEVPKYEKHS